MLLPRDSSEVISASHKGWVIYSFVFQDFQNNLLFDCVSTERVIYPNMFVTKHPK